MGKTGNEIERRWLLKKLPPEIDIVFGGYKESHIKQAYIFSNPVLRLRSHDDSEFIFCIKTKGDGKGLGKPEGETPLSKEEFTNLFNAFIKKEPLTKTRYYIPIKNNLIAELDIFSEPYVGLFILEVEFLSEKSAKNFIPPSWFGSNEITGNKKYSNSFLYQGMPDLKK